MTQDIDYRVNNKKKSKPRMKILNTWSLLILTLTFIFTLWLVTPTKIMLLKLIARSTSPEISLSFLQVLQGQDPDDREIKLLIAQSYYQLGNIDSAIPLVEQLLIYPNKTKDWHAYSLYLDLLLEGFYSKKPSLKTISTKKIDLLLFSITYIPDAEVARKFADAAKSLNMPARAFLILTPHLNGMETDYEELIKLALQTSDYESALQLQFDAFFEDVSINSLKHFLEIKLASGQTEQTNPLLEDYNASIGIEQYPSTLPVAPSPDTKDIINALHRSNTISNTQSNPELLSETADLAAALGSLKLATLLLNKSYDLSPTDEKLIRLHQIYRWQSNIDKAFQTSLLLITDSSTEKQLRDALEESKALGDIYHEAQFYEQLANNYIIKPAEYNDWLNALEKAQGTNAAVLSVDKLSKKRPHDTALISELSRLYSYTSKHQLVVKQYGKLKQYREPTFKEATRFSDAYIMIHQPQQALDVLTAPKNWLGADDKYLQTVLSLAWVVGDKAVATASQKQLVTRSNTNLDVYRYIQLNGPFTGEDIITLVALYKKSAKKELLLLAIRTAYEDLLRLSNHENYEYDDSKETMNMLLTLALESDSIKDNTEVLYYRALFAVHQNNRVDAHNFFAKTLSIDKFYLPAIASYLWWSIVINDQQKIRYLYQTYSLPLSDNHELWFAFASAAQQLGEYEQADVWYKKLLTKNTEPDVEELINYASLLEIRGQTESAYRLREFIARNRLEELIALPDGDISLRSLVALFAGNVAALELTTRNTLLKPTNNTVEEFFQYQLALEQTGAIKFWHQRTAFSDYALSDQLQLAIAINNHDTSTIERLLKQSVSLSPAERYYALRLTGQGQLAWEEGQEKIGATAKKEEEIQLRNIHVNQHSSKTHSVRSQYSSNSQWGIDKFSVEHFSPLHDGYWKLGADFQSADTPEILVGNDIDNEFRLRIDYKHLLEVSDFMIGLDIADGLGDKRLGLKLNYETLIDDYWTLGFRLGINNDIQGSQLLALSGSDNVIGFNFNYQPTARESLAFQMNYHDMSNRFDDDIGTAWEGSIRASEQIFFVDPAWQLYSEYSMHQANLNNEFLTGINSWSQGANIITSNDYLTEEYQRISLGQRLWHGQPGAVGPSVPSPRYWFDSSVGYNFVTNQPDITLRTGIGVRIIGNDELYFNLDWQSQDRNGDQSLIMSFGYYYGF